MVSATRPQAPLSHADPDEHRRLIAQRANGSLPKDGGQAMDGALKLASFTVATVPTASENTNGLIYVSDEAGGAVPAFSDGTNWRRVTDRAVIS